jgi:uncharacterized lipoprotein YddW (UPF0748 family)
MRFFAAAFLIYFFPLAQIASGESSPRLGLWAEVEGAVRVYDTPADYERFLSFIEEHPFSDLFCQVYRGGKSWFPSGMADSTPYIGALEQGIDPLGDTLSVAKRRGQRVYAWLNMLRVEQPTAKFLERVGKEVAQLDRFGVSLAEYDAEGYSPDGAYRLDTPGVWLDPAHAQLREALLRVIDDLLSGYPDLDGIHLDMIRYPFIIPGRTLDKRSNSVGYSDVSVSRFASKNSPLANSRLPGRMPAGEAWNDWRREQVTILLREIKHLRDLRYPGKTISAAVLGPYERARNYSFQDWRGWINEGLLDFVVLMSYTPKTNDVVEQAKFALNIAGRDRVSIGLGAWLMLGKENVLSDQVIALRRLGVNRVTLFSYANLATGRGNTLMSKAAQLFSAPPAVQQLEQDHLR